jgi:hypothetical protein
VFGTFQTRLEEAWTAVLRLLTCAHDDMEEYETNEALKLQGNDEDALSDADLHKNRNPLLAADARVIHTLGKVVGQWLLEEPGRVSAEVALGLPALMAQQPVSALEYPAAYMLPVLTVLVADGPGGDADAQEALVQVCESMARTDYFGRLLTCVSGRVLEHKAVSAQDEFAVELCALFLEHADSKLARAVARQGLPTHQWRMLVETTAQPCVGGRVLGFCALVQHLLVTSVGAEVLASHVGEPSTLLGAMGNLATLSFVARASVSGDEQTTLLALRVYTHMLRAAQSSTTSRAWLLEGGVRGLSSKQAQAQVLQFFTDHQPALTRTCLASAQNREVHALVVRQLTQQQQLA